MVLFLYNLALLLVLLLGSPWWLWQMAATRKYREGLSERLGRIPIRLQQWLLDAADHRPVIWLHAVSVGEVLAVSRLVSELEFALPDYRLVLSTTTRTGQALARQRFGSHRVFYCPLDLPWAVSSWLNTLRPAMLILAETEFWPNLLSGCFRRGIPIAVVNARISDRSWPRYQRLRSLWKPWLSRLAAVLAQSELDAQRLSGLGCTAVTVTGNLKFDVRASEESGATQLLKTRASHLRLLVAGSTLEGEEELLFSAWTTLTSTPQQIPLAMVLAPRHPERFLAIAALLGRSRFRWRLRSTWGNAPEPLIAGEIVLLDTIGELASVYSQAAVAFVGGSLIPAGGHNPLEPAQFAVPTIMGPHYSNFRGVVEALIKGNGIAITSSTDLPSALASLLHDQAAASEMGKHARQIFEAQAGASARTVEAIRQLLTRGTA